MASQISKHTFQWDILDLADDRQETKTFIMQAFDVEVRCSAFCSKAYTQFDRHQQTISYELAWKDCESTPLLYSRNVSLVYGGARLLLDKTHSRGGHVCCSIDFPKCAAPFPAKRGMLNVEFVFEFILDGAGVKASYLSLLEEKLGTDVVVVCGDAHFDCHKAILAGRSEFFKTMLTVPFKEARENKINLKDFTPDTVKSVIHYIYADNVAEDSVSWELYEAAKMYALPDLQSTCLCTLRKNLNVDNCCKMLEATFTHNLNEMFEHTMEFTRKNKSEVRQTDGWKALLQNPGLVDKIIGLLM